jgi:hypothetical protein
MPYLVGLLTLAIMVFALIDIIMRPDDEVKYLPKFFWLIVVILLPFIGSVLWFTIGREWPQRVIAPRQRPAAQNTAPQGWDMPATPMDTRSTEQQMADLDREIEEWRLREEIAKRAQERGDQGEN